MEEVGLWGDADEVVVSSVVVCVGDVEDEDVAAAEDVSAAVVVAIDVVAVAAAADRNKTAVMGKS